MEPPNNGHIDLLSVAERCPYLGDSYLGITSNYTLPTVALSNLVAIAMDNRACGSIIHAIATLPEVFEFDIT